MINFYNEEDVTMPPIREGLLRLWLTRLVEEREKRIGELTYLFCSDAKILEVNRQFLDHDYYTDIITFDECRGHRVSGDLLISLETVRSNASLLGQSYERELHRVIVHGLLHLLGQGDKTEEEAEQMRKLEDDALERLYALSRLQGEVSLLRRDETSEN